MRLFVPLIFILLIFTADRNCIAESYLPTGPEDALLVTGNDGTVFYEKNSSERLVPASVLKILTSLSALHYLGGNYRFKTEFYIRNDSDLVIKGYGDPLLISEVIKYAAENLKMHLNGQKQLRNIILDNSYYSCQPVPGAISSSAEPYDAGTGALCANFNTVSFITSPDGKLQSAEKQTPLLPFVVKRIKDTGLQKGRIVLTKKEQLLYPGHLFRYFLNKNSISTSGSVITGKNNPDSDKPVYTLVSPYTVSELVEKLLEFSNNFIANQLFLHIGAGVYGEPATLEKGVRATRKYTDILAIRDNRISDYIIVEGSGLSRKNRISAKALDAVLEFFYPFRSLLRKEKNELYKTGTLSGISTRAGYIEFDKKSYRYVILCNTKGFSSATIADRIIRELKKNLPEPHQ